jgi:hypothetical protein
MKRIAVLMAEDRMSERSGLSRDEPTSLCLT